MDSGSPAPPTLADLPPPPPGRSGWPWTEAPPPLPETAPDGSPWPRISIITPSFNQGRYIEETIRSILLQGYPDLEYHIIDGGSTDETVEIIRKYEQWLSGWVSEKDKGQSDAINKGFARCDGEVFNWMCSDDFLTPGALAVVGAAFVGNDACDVLAGACFCQYDDEPARSEAREAKPEGWETTPYAAGIWQPSCYFRRSLVGRSDLVLRDLHFCMDRELWCHFFRQGARWKWSGEVLSHYRFTGENKSQTGRGKIIDEIATIYADHVRGHAGLARLLRGCWLPLVMAKLRGRNPLSKAVLRFSSRIVTMALSCVYPRVHIRTLQKEFYCYSVW